MVSYLEKDPRSLATFFSKRMLEVSVARYGKDSLGTLRPFRVLTQTQVEERRTLLFTTDPQRAGCLHTQWAPCG